MALTDLIARLETISSLPKNWNGYHCVIDNILQKDFAAEIKTDFNSIPENLQKAIDKIFESD